MFTRHDVASPLRLSSLHDQSVQVLLKMKEINTPIVSSHLHPSLDQLVVVILVEIQLQIAIDITKITNIIIKLVINPLKSRTGSCHVEGLREEARNAHQFAMTNMISINDFHHGFLPIFVIVIE